MSRVEDETAPKRPASVVYQRDKKTKRSVLFTDFLARASITIGGSLVIIAVFTIMAFLIYVCLPLLNAGSVTGLKQYQVPTGAQPLAELQVDDNRTVAADVQLDGQIKAFHVGTGTPLSVSPYDLGGLTATAFASTLRGDDVLFGFADGTVRVGRFHVRADVVPGDQVPNDLRKLDERDATDGVAVFSHIPGQYRRTSVETSIDAPVKVADPGVAIIKADYRVGGTAERPLKTFVTLDASGKLRLSQAYSETNLMTGEVSVQLSNALVPLDVPATDVTKVLLNTTGDRVLVGLSNGTLLRYNTRDFANPKLAERVKVAAPGAQISALSYLNGETSVVVGGSDGSVSIWFGVDRKSKETSDGVVLTKVHGNFEKQPAAITDIRVSQRTRLFITADAGGNIWLRHGTTERTLLSLPHKGNAAYQSTALLPKDDGVLAIGSAGEASLWGIDVPHPETTLQSLFGKVWYEGYDEPVYVWQSTASSDAVEPKLSLVPLIFGTFKAAIYSLLLAIPIALLSAIYTSEFLTPSARAVAKPVMELMATLPSVVVGFVAALVLSPIVENWIAAIVIAFAIVPLTLISMAFLWQLLPPSIANALNGSIKLLAYLAGVAGAIWLSSSLGPTIERMFFGGDFKKWTAGAGSGQPFMFLILIPVAFLIALLLTRPIFGVAYRERLRGLSGPVAAVSDLLGWLVIVALAGAVAWGGSVLLAGVGYDVRGGFVDTYVQRNALVVAFAMAFAEIPIIYTIAEDALNAVPSYLRSGSLACGASVWQTATRIVLPTAASGIFSAIMIGLGRAVGETMIVVMATGNTPVLDLNVFNGLRTLSANINVELPEAVRDSTLYRTLFLCALVLFLVTFVINTVAELVRQRYRRRAAQL